MQDKLAIRLQKNKHDFKEQLYMCYIDLNTIKASQNSHVLQNY